MALRAQYAVGYAVAGLHMDMDEAIRLLRNTHDDYLTKEDIEKRDILVAAVNNLVEFAVCEEYQMYKDVLEINPDIYDEGIDINDDEASDLYFDIFGKYNEKYSLVENSDIYYALSIAYTWLHCSPATYLTYMTQNDDRVRPWHYALQGFTAKRDDFPGWMIPPIEWGCRCFLISEYGDIIASGDKIKDVRASTEKFMKEPDKPEQLDGIFSESICKCGRIFSKAHPYFKVDESDSDKLQEYVDTIKRSYYAKV